MLTASDLKAIKKIVREEVEAEVKDSANNLEGQIRLSGMRIQNEINDLDDRMKNIEIRVDEVDKKLEPIKKDVKYLRRKVNRIDKTVSLIARTTTRQISSWKDALKELSNT